MKWADWVFLGWVVGLAMILAAMYWLVTGSLK